MTFLTIAVIAIGLLVAFLVASVPRRTVQLLEASEIKKARTEELARLLAQLSEMREQTRSMIEQAAQRPDLALTQEEVSALQAIRATCETVLPGLDEASPILDRYFRNHIAVIHYILGESDPEASPTDLIKNSLEDIYRSQAAERSSHPIALMEKRLAIGLGPT